MARKPTHSAANGRQRSGNPGASPEGGRMGAHIEEQRRQIQAQSNALEILTSKMDTMSDYLRYWCKTKSQEWKK